MQDIGFELPISCSKAYAAIGFAQNPTLYDLAVQICDEALKGGALLNPQAQEIWRGNYNIDSILRAFGSAMQMHKIEVHLTSLAQNKQAAKSVIDSFEAFKAEIYFKAESYGALKDKDESCLLIASMKRSFDAKAGPDMAQLVDSLNHLQQNKIWSNEELITNLKSQTDVKDFAHITIRACQTHHYAKVCQNINKLFDERYLNIHGKEFDCPLEYIKHEIAKPAQYTCPQRLGAKLAQVNAHMQQQELARSLEHHMHGP